MNRQLLIYGGSFDPIHNGHLLPLKDVLVKHYFDKVIFVPCHQQPLKEQANVSAEQRLSILKVAIDNSGIGNATVSDIEIARGGKSYTIDTLSYFKEQFTDYALSFVVGMDSLYSLQKWHRWREILDLSNLLVMNRGGQSFDKTKVDEQVLEYLNTKIKLVDTQSLSISSTEIRQQLKLNRFDAIHDLMPEKVVEHLLANNLYIN